MSSSQVGTSDWVSNGNGAREEGEVRAPTGKTEDAGPTSNTNTLCAALSCERGRCPKTPAPAACAAAAAGLLRRLEEVRLRGRANVRPPLVDELRRKRCFGRMRTAVPIRRICAGSNVARDQSCGCVRPTRRPRKWDG